MAEFKSHESYRRFAESVTSKWRYARNAEQTEFLQTVLATSTSRQEVLKSETILWRAQRGHDMRADQSDSDEGEYPCALKPERMKPRANRASEGRANPRGIPYLYLATEEATAIAEVRPWISSYVSIAQFALRREVRVVNCVSDYQSTIIYTDDYEPAPDVREQRVWRDIDRAFSQPVTLADDIAEYAPAQVLAEFFRERGLDGVAYGSSLGDGHSLALFDPHVAKLLNCRLVRISRVKLSYSDEDNPYFITDKDERN
jgi:hypothetical protein